MYSEFPASKPSERLIRAIMCLNSTDAPKGYFLTPAIRRSGIVISLQNNVKIKSEHNEIIPPKASFKGVFDTPYFFSYLGREVTTLAVDLRPIALYEITKKPGDFFKNKYVNLNAIWEQEEIDQLILSLSHEDLMIEERARIFEHYVISKINPIVSEKGEIVEKVSHIIKEHHFNISLDQITDELIISRRTLERVFKEVLGVSPKKYFSISIFEDMIRAHSIQKENTMSDFLESPFYDFSHINKWFKKFANTSPRDFSSYDMNVIANILSSSI